MVAQGVLDDIPAHLKDKANEIVLHDHTEFSIQDLSRSSLHRKYRIVIMNSRGAARKSVYLFYDKYRTIKDAQIKAYDIYGKEKQHIKLKGFGDYSTKGSSIASDSRTKYYEVVEDKYPFIIEVEYSIDYSGSMFYPVWIPQSDENQSVIRSTLSLNCPKSGMFRHKSTHVTPDESEVNGMLTYTWQVDSLKAFEFEPYSSSFEDYAPIVYTAPNEFQMDGYTGNLSTWSEFGAWIRHLNSDRNTLTSEEISTIKALIPENATQLEMVEIAYKYLQDNTRYVSIQLGIGGWQPFESGFVHANKYGDCKALSFYTQSILSELGVKSYYTLINAGPNARKVDPNFPNAHFNHAILTVPLEQDTIWLECTSQTNPFGYLGTFTGNRNALMITENDAIIVKTKGYSPEENLQATFATINIEKDGSASAEIRRTYSGLEISNNGFSASALMGATEQSKWFYDSHKWGDLKLNSLSLTPLSNEVVPKGEMIADISITKAAIANSNRLFYQPFVFTNINYIKFPSKERLKPLELKYGYSQVDTLKVTFPEVFFSESPLNDASIQTNYGSYERVIIQDQNQFLIIRKLQFKSGTYPPSEYDSLREFIKEVQKYDREKMVMLNKT